MNNTFICLDLGASNTRYCSDDGVNHWLPNNVTVIDQEKITKLDAWNEDNTEDMVRNNLDVTIEKLTGESSFFPLRALVGKIAERYSPSSERPSGMQNKYVQRINYINAIVATAVSRLLDEQVGELVNEVHMYMALPPVETKQAIEFVNNELVGDYKVSFNMLNRYVKLRILDVKCLEESYMAITSFFFRDGKKRPEAEPYTTGYVLSIDIGASTTDLTVAQDKKFLERTGQTFKIGGNVVRDSVLDALQAQLNIDGSIEMAEQAVAEGRLPFGASYKDVSGIVKDAKSEFATQIVNSMQTYFKKVGIPVQYFKAFVVSGGGSMRGEYCDDNGQTVITSEPMSFYITEKLKAICDTVDVKYIEDSPRLANIKGMFTKALRDKARRARGLEV